ncbi:hypothetical protein [Arthrobacter sp. SO3]|uniref:hypothetical protein n=1 Tax=Arthrobacter sp. SO3 TaxID=1897057 RepID=UPI001D0002D7|nr:hypothetical protein [Arthrobacter sp. SO3]MCB5291485.1 hypothetical protein [Arthrobacter sp. SO3]
MAPMKKRMGRPSLGPRDVFTVKLTLSDGERLRELADLQNLSYQDLLEMIVSRSLADVDLEKLKDQGALFSKAS